MYRRFARVVGKKPFGQEKTNFASSTPQIPCHGGPVLGTIGPVTLYVIYYGNNWPSTTQPLINAFLGGLSGTPQFNVNTTYCEKSTTACSGGDLPFQGLLDYRVDPAQSRCLGAAEYSEQFCHIQDPAVCASYCSWPSAVGSQWDLHADHRPDHQRAGFRDQLLCLSHAFPCRRRGH